MTSCAIRSALLAVALVAALGCATVSPTSPIAIASVPDPPPMPPSEAHIQSFWQRVAPLMATGTFSEVLQVSAEVWSRGWHWNEVAYAAACAASRAGRLDEAFVWLERSVDTGKLDTGWMNEDADLVAVRADPRYAALHAKARRVQERRVAEMNVGGGIEKSTPAAEGVDATALKALLERAEVTRSSALVILRSGKLIGEWYFGGPSALTETMSATKSITSLAIGILVDEGRIRSLDEPVATFFPEWRDGVHDAITLRHILSHTSGLHADRTTQKIYASKDFVRFALDSGIDAPAGSQFFYNNSAVNILPGVVERASGQRMDDYLRQKLLEPLGIREISWSLDPGGNPHGMAGLQIHAADLAKIGQLMLDGGTWNGKRLLSQAWIDESAKRRASTVNPTAGLLWWLEAPQSHYVLDQSLFDALRAGGADPAFIAALTPLLDKPIPRPDFSRALERALGSDGVRQWMTQAAQRRLNPRTVVTGAYDGFSARGSFGQTLVVYPERELVAVRFTRTFDGSSSDVDFSDFASLVRALANPRPE